MILTWLFVQVDLLKRYCLLVAVRPSSVRLLEKPASMVAGEEILVSCSAVGSRPQAELSWFRENRKFKRGKVTIEINLNVKFYASAAFRRATRH